MPRGIALNGRIGHRADREADLPVGRNFLECLDQAAFLVSQDRGIQMIGEWPAILLEGRPQGCGVLAVALLPVEDVAEFPRVVSSASAMERSTEVMASVTAL